MKSRITPQGKENCWRHNRAPSAYALSPEAGMSDWANMQTAVLEWEGESWHCFAAKINTFYSLYTLRLPGMQLQCKLGEGRYFLGELHQDFPLTSCATNS